MSDSPRVDTDGAIAVLTIDRPATRNRSPGHRRTTTHATAGVCSSASTAAFHSAFSARQPSSVRPSRQ